MKSFALAIPLAVTIASACGGGGGSVDPRCNSVCTITEPDLDGAYDICSPASADQCKQECTARITKASSLCASCLLEDACFEPDCGPTNGPFCNAAGRCTVTGRNGSCEYAQSDSAARDACIRQVEPRRTVSCTTEYRPVSECSALCAGSGGTGGGGGTDARTGSGT